MPEQDSLQLFPLHIAYFIGSPWPSADMKRLAVTADKHEFAIKFEEDAVGLPASEWLGCKLAQACRIAVPWTAIMVDDKGRVGFGSRIEGAGHRFSDHSPQERAAMMTSCAQVMSANIALDIFCGNDDRHLNNWVFRKNTQDQWALLCIDFSRALFVRDFPNLPPFTNNNTLTTQRMLKATQNWHGPFAVFAIQQIQEIKPATVARWLDECPETWLSPKKRQELTDWWGSTSYHEHLQRVLALL